MNDKVKPSWWLLDGVVIAITLGLLVLQWAALSPLVRQLLQVAAVLLGYWLIAIWLRANAVALEAEEQHSEKAPMRRTAQAGEIDTLPNARQKHFRRVMTFYKEKTLRRTRHDETI